LSKIDGVGGVHLMAPNNDAALPLVIAQARKAL